MSEFDAALPDLKKMRDVAEYIDDCAYGEGHNESVDRAMMESSCMTGDHLPLQWPGDTLSPSAAIFSGQKLFVSIQGAGSVFTALLWLCSQAGSLERLLDVWRQTQGGSRWCLN